LHLYPSLFIISAIFIKYILLITEETILLIISFYPFNQFYFADYCLLMFYL